MPKPVGRVGVSRVLCQPSPLQCASAGARNSRRSSLPAGERAAFVVHPPAGIGRAHAFDLIAPVGLRRHVEDPLVTQRAQQLDVLGMGPDQRHRRSRGPAAEELALGQVVAVPDLLGQQMPVAGEAFERAQQRLGAGSVAGGEFVMRALAGEQRPGPADSGAVEGRPVRMLAIAVAIVAPPARPRRQVDLEQGVDDAQRVADARIIRRPQPEPHQRQRVRAHHRGGALQAMVGRAILDRHEAVDRAKCRRPRRRARSAHSSHRRRARRASGVPVA